VTTLVLLHTDGQSLLKEVNHTIHSTFCNSMFCPIRHYFYSTFCPIRYYFYSTFCPIQHYVPFGLYYFRHYVYSAFCPIRHFIPFDVCRSKFCTFGVCYFDILSVHWCMQHELGQGSRTPAYLVVCTELGHFLPKPIGSVDRPRKIKHIKQTTIICIFIILIIIIMSQLCTHNMAKMQVSGRHPEIKFSL
jgi:hypothetical protein